MTTGPQAKRADEEPHKRSNKCANPNFLRAVGSGDTQIVFVEKTISIRMARKRVHR
jgi:hypothetical protein